MLNERDVTTLWRKRFQGQRTTPELLSEAEALLDRLSRESPLRVRRAKELEDIRKLQSKR
jgi:hypothetical protein